MFKLIKDENRSFTVLNLTDPHLTEDEQRDGYSVPELLFKTVDELVKRANPDLITVTGDIAWAGRMSAYKKFFALLDSYKIPWAVAWGNHDNQEGREQTEIQADLLLKHEYCLFEKNDKSLGSGNYSIAIEENGKIIYGIVMMDSHDRISVKDADGNESSVWAHLLPEQLEWYRTESEALGDCKNVLLMHIPIYGYRKAFASAWNHDFEPKSISTADSYDEKYWNDGYKGSFGVKREKICSCPTDFGEYEFIKSLGKADLFIAGHDHVNNFVIEHEGIKFVYGLKTGCGAYWDEDLSGGTVIKIEKDKREVTHLYVESKSLA